MLQLQQASVPVFVTGGLQGHVALNCRQASLLHRVLAVEQSVQGASPPLPPPPAQQEVLQVHLLLEEASLSHIFKHASVDFYTNMPRRVKPPAKAAAETNAAQPGAEQKRVPPTFRLRRDAAADENDERARLSWSFGSFFSKVWSGARSLGKTVVNVAQGIYSGVKALVTGDYSLDKTWNVYTWRYNYDASSQSAITEDVPIDAYTSCTDCYAEVDVDLTFRLRIQNYALQELAVLSSGKMLVNLEVRVSKGGCQTSSGGHRQASTSLQRNSAKGPLSRITNPLFTIHARLRWRHPHLPQRALNSAACLCHLPSH
jgi:hypothetical protein